MPQQESPDVGFRKMKSVGEICNNLTPSKPKPTAQRPLAELIDELEKLLAAQELERARTLLAEIVSRLRRDGYQALAEVGDALPVEQAENWIERVRTELGLPRKRKSWWKR